jgi:hypothetical protein
MHVCGIASLAFFSITVKPLEYGIPEVVPQEEESCHGLLDGR